MGNKIRQLIPHTNIIIYNKINNNIDIYIILSCKSNIHCGVIEWQVKNSETKMWQIIVSVLNNPSDL